MSENVHIWQYLTPSDSEDVFTRHCDACHYKEYFGLQVHFLKYGTCIITLPVLGFFRNFLEGL